MLLAIAPSVSERSTSDNSAYVMLTPHTGLCLVLCVAHLRSARKKASARKKKEKESKEKEEKEKEAKEESKEESKEEGKEEEGAEKEGEKPPVFPPEIEDPTIPIRSGTPNVALVLDNQEFLHYAHSCDPSLLNIMHIQIMSSLLSSACFH